MMIYDVLSMINAISTSRCGNRLPQVAAGRHRAGPALPLRRRASTTRIEQPADILPNCAYYCALTAKARSERLVVDNL